MILYVNDRVKSLIGWWKLRGERESDSFLKFFIFYLCFDAWITSESGEDNDFKKIRWFLNNDNCLKEQWFNIQGVKLRSSLNGLKKESPIRDMRPSMAGVTVKLDDIDNLEQVVGFIYQIRCNLFHGSKSTNNIKDKRLVTLGSKVMEQWIVWAYEKCLARN